MDLKTFHEWSRLGYRINKGSKTRGGSKATGYLFSRDQVTYVGSRYKGMRYAHESRNPFYDEEDDADFAQAYGLPWGGLD